MNAKTNSLSHTFLTLTNYLSALPSSVVFTETSEGFIKVTTFQVPSQARLGELIRLVCIYELGSETLRAMKLFKDDKEVSGLSAAAAAAAAAH